MSYIAARSMPTTKRLGHDHQHHHQTSSTLLATVYYSCGAVPLIALKPRSIATDWQVINQEISDTFFVAGGRHGAGGVVEAGK